MARRNPWKEQFDAGRRSERRAARREERRAFLSSNVEPFVEPGDPLPIRTGSGNYCPRCKAPLTVRESDWSPEGGWQVRYVCSTLPVEQARIGDVTALVAGRLCGWKSVRMSINASDVLGR